MQASKAACTDLDFFKGELGEQTLVISDYQAKKHYENKLVQDFANMNTKGFNHVRTLTGQSIKPPICVSDPITFAINLNNLCPF